ncbi:hypothetical protein ACFZC5_30875 [Nocardia gamkensis]|uniref:ATP dependent DNA ligase n=1 Tax=Nocardia gamkensis TaxID=352869 RepID=UPI0036E32255
MVYVGHVGAGFTRAIRRALLERLTGLAATDSPFDRPALSWRATAARWVTPQLVGAVEYREFVGALRHPSWRGLRAEIDPSRYGYRPETFASLRSEAAMAGCPLCNATVTEPRKSGVGVTTGVPHQPAECCGWNARRAGTPGAGECGQNAAPHRWQ